MSYIDQIPEIVGVEPGTLKTIEGDFVDLMSGTSCTGLGFGADAVTRLLQRAHDIPLNTYAYQTVWHREAEEALATLLPDYQFYWFSSGAEAVEAAIRVAKCLAPARPTVVGLRGGFHGKTFLTGLLSDEEQYGEATAILPWDTKSVTVPLLASCVVAEPIQCRNGVRVPSSRFLSELVRQTRSMGAIFVDDEVSTSIRTGHALAIQHFLPNYQPDIICLGKNYGQGIPVSLVGVRDDLAPDVRVSMTSGYGGNPLACIAVAESVRYIVEHDTLTRNRVLGEQLLRELLQLERNYPLQVVEVRGLGMWLAIEFDSETLAAEVAFRLLSKHRFIVGLVDCCIRLAPWFDLELEAWQRFVNAVEESLVAARAGHLQQLAHESSV